MLNIDPQKMKEMCDSNQIRYLGLFGSHARNEEREDSDIDLLIEYGSSKSMFDHVRLQRKFSAMLGKQVDLVTKRSLHPYIQEYVYKDLKVLYEK